MLTKKERERDKRKAGVGGQSGRRVGPSLDDSNLIPSAS